MAPSLFASAAFAAGLLASTTSAAYNAAAKTNIAMYWGQGNNQIPLSEVCADPTIDIVNIGFVNKFPKKRGEYPGTNHANACGDSYYIDPTTNQPSGLLSSCPGVGDAITACQKSGKKVMLSLGGGWPVDYYLPTPDAANWFAEFLIGAYGPVTEEWTNANMPRPFGDAVVDGFDLDLEAADYEMPSPEYIYENYDVFGKYVKANSNMFLSGAPQCVVPDARIFQALQEVPFDWLFTQFYNTWTCSAAKAVEDIKSNSPSTFTFNDWVAWLQANSKNKDIKLFLGLAAGPDGLPTNKDQYLEPEDANLLIETYKGNSMFGGVMLWEATVSKRNPTYDQSYGAWMKYAVEGTFTENFHPVLSSSAVSSIVPPSSTPVSSTPVSSTPVSSTPVSSTPVSSTPVSSAPVSSAPVSSVKVTPSVQPSSYPVSSIQISSSVLPSSAPVSSIKVTPSVQPSTYPASSAQVSSSVLPSGYPASSAHVSSSIPVSSVQVTPSVKPSGYPVSSVQASSGVLPSGYPGSSISVAPSVQPSGYPASSAQVSSSVIPSSAPVVSSMASSSPYAPQSSSVATVSSSSVHIPSNSEISTSCTTSSGAYPTAPSSSLGVYPETTPEAASSTPSTSSMAYSMSYPVVYPSKHSSVKSQAYPPESSKGYGEYPVASSAGYSVPSVTKKPEQSGYPTVPTGSTTSVVTTTYVDVCPTGLTTVTTTYIATVCTKCAKPTGTTHVPEGWTTSVYTASTVTVTITKPIATATGVPAYPSSAPSVAYPAEYPAAPSGAYPAEHSAAPSVAYPAGYPASPVSSGKPPYPVVPEASKAAYPAVPEASKPAYPAIPEASEAAYPAAPASSNMAEYPVAPTASKMAEYPVVPTASKMAEHPAPEYPAHTAVPSAAYPASSSPIAEYPSQPVGDHPKKPVEHQVASTMVVTLSKVSVPAYTPAPYPSAGAPYVPAGPAKNATGVYAPMPTGTGKPTMPSASVSPEFEGAASRAGVGLMMLVGAVGAVLAM